MSTRITVEEITERLAIGRDAVYALLEKGEIPAIRLGRRWIISRHAYLAWERSFGTRKGGNSLSGPVTTETFAESA